MTYNIRYDTQPRSSNSSTGGQTAGQTDMRSALEKRIGEMRKFLDVDQDKNDATDTLDITGISCDLF
jgi:hypothetical protein